MKDFGWTNQSQILNLPTDCDTVPQIQKSSQSGALFVFMKEVE
jgi:hypothetical protein